MWQSGKHLRGVWMTPGSACGRGGWCCIRSCCCSFSGSHMLREGSLRFFTLILWLCGIVWILKRLQWGLWLLSSCPLQRLGFSVFVSTATAAFAAFFLQILLFSSNLSSFPLLQHWLLPVRNCSSIPCAEVHLLSSLQWANCSLCPVGTGWVFSGAGVGCYRHLGFVLC